MERGTVFLNIFARNLKELREKSDISRAEMADLLGITTAAYSFYETAKRQPGLDNLCKIAAALHVTTDELLGYDGESVWRKKYDEAQRQLDAIRKILGDEH